MTLFSTLFAGPVVLNAGQKVIKEQDLSNLLESKQVLQEAKAVAEKRLQETAKECERLKAEAIEAGKQEGLEKFNEHILALDSSAKKIYHDTQKILLFDNFLSCV